MKTENMLKTTFALTLFFLFTTIAVGKKAEKDPKAEKILNAFVTEIGGKKAISAIENLTCKSKLEFVESGLILEREILETRSSQYFIKVSSPQTGEIYRGYDGKRCWEKRRAQTREIVGDEKQSFLNASAFLRFANWEKLLKSFEYKGIEERTGRKVHRIDVVTVWGAKESWYFNKSDNLLAQMEEPLDLPEGPSTATTTFSDYRDVNGVKLSFVQTISMPGQNRKITFSKISANRDIDQNLFSFPGSK